MSIQNGTGPLTSMVRLRDERGRAGHLRARSAGAAAPGYSARNRSLIRYYHAMMLPGSLFLLVFSIVPMAGLVAAFQDFQPIRGFFRSPFVGFHNFELMLTFRDARQVMLNTVVIAGAKIVLSLAVPLVFALLLNECRSQGLKRTIQTIVYLPHFLSWVIVAVMFGNILSYTGVVNRLLAALGHHEPLLFLASNVWFRPIVIGTDVWKNFGFGAVVYIAAITGIDVNLYEAAGIDGANRWQKMWFVTLPGIMSTIVIMATLSLGNVLNAGFEQVFNMYSPIVYQTGDIIDTYVYRVGLEELRYSFGTAVGLFKSVVSFALIVLSYKLADRLAGYRIF